MDQIVTTDMQFQMNRLRDSLALRFKLLGGRWPVILKRQAGLLWRTLINITPPHDRAKANARIQAAVTGKFHVLGSSDHNFSDIPNDSKHGGNGSVRWYAFSKWAVYGVSKDVDMTKASVEQLKFLYFNTQSRSRTGRVNLGKRGKQTFYAWNKITTKQSTVNKLVKRFQDHVGRLKAGWSVAWEACGKPGRSLPAWIEKHAGQGARGSVVMDIGPNGGGSITAVNSAKGCSEINKNNLLTAACRIRADAVVKDVQFAIAHPKEWSEREAASGAGEISE